MTHRPIPIALPLALILVLGHVLGGCAGHRSAEPPGCGSGPRRPANPYGSVLVAAPAPGALPKADAEIQPDSAPEPGGCT